MFATVTIEVQGKTTLTVARSPVLYLGDQTVVFLDAGKSPSGQARFIRRPVTVDDDDAAEYVPVLRGLQAGDQVVASQAILLSSLAK
jgi:hypothetical protein